MAEAAVATYLGVEVPEDWTLDGDRKRGYDVGGVHVRSSLTGSRYVWRPGRDYPGWYIFAITGAAPDIWLTGYLHYLECETVSVPGHIGDQLCRYILPKTLKQLPATAASGKNRETRAA
jgi:hypothetical protein